MPSTLGTYCGDMPVAEWEKRRKDAVVAEAAKNERVVIDGRDYWCCVHNRQLARRLMAILPPWIEVVAVGTPAGQHLMTVVKIRSDGRMGWFGVDSADGSVTDPDLVRAAIATLAKGVQPCP